MKRILFFTFAMMMSALTLFSCKNGQGQKSANDEYAALFSGEVDTFCADGGTSVRFYSIKHATMAILAGTEWIYVDAATEGSATPTDFSNMPKADFILFTHDHTDHFSAEAVKQLSKETTRVIGNTVTIAALGYGDSIRNGESIITEENWIIDAVPAYNISESKLQFHPQGRDNGYILEIDGLRIYIAGDTEDIPEMADIKDIDVAFLPCNLPFTMTPEQLSAAARMFMPKVLFPYHYGETDIQQVNDILSDTDIDVRIRQYQ